MRRTGHSGYANRRLAFLYSVAGCLYDPVVWLVFLPMGGERRLRRGFVQWLEVRPGQSVVSLCCGTGSMERALLDEVPDLRITGVDLSSDQLARARRKLEGTGVRLVQADVTRTGLPDGRFDRVLICLALHEMPREPRLAALREARRLCSADGKVLAIEHGRPSSRWSRFARALLWGYWIPGNPERATVRDLERHGLENEMRESGLEVVEHHVTRPDWIEAYLARRP